jgi:hypothetical protein
MTTWSNASTPVTSWSNSTYDFANLWSDWAAFTWAQIQAQGLTWEGLSGNQFNQVTQPSTTWTRV